MAKDPNQVEIERQQCEMRSKGYSDNEIHNPNVMQHHSNTGDNAEQYHNSLNSNKRSKDCLPAGTKVLTPNGWVNIESIAKGDKVLSLGNRGDIREAIVLNLNKFSSSPITIIRTESGIEPIRATKSHSFKTERGWLRVDEIRIGDKIWNVDNNSQIKYRSVADIEHDTSIEPVFNILVEKDYTFVTQGGIAHSFSYFRALRILVNELVRIIKPKSNKAPSTQPA